MIRWRLILSIMFFAFSSHASAFEVDFSDQIKADSHFKAAVNKFVVAVRKSVPKHGVTGAVCSEKKILQRLGSRLPEEDDVKGLQYYYDGKVLIFFRRDKPGASSELLYIGINIDKTFSGTSAFKFARDEFRGIEKRSGVINDASFEKMIMHYIYEGRLTPEIDSFVDSKLSLFNHHHVECGSGKYGEFD